MEITVISGKGGTGKTTVAVAIAELEKECLKVDCDVDAPNMYLYYNGWDISAEEFSGGKKAIVDREACLCCGMCLNTCRFEAIENGIVEDLRCEGCGACVLTCPTGAIGLKDEKTADVYMTDTSRGILSRAQMVIGSEGSGKLITLIRKNVQKYSQEQIMVSDGSPGIGCPVISSVTGTDAALIVTEPTQSGLEDLTRIVELCRQFGILTFICINKADINEEISEAIEEYCLRNELIFAGRIPYDETVLCSINELKPIIYYEKSPAGIALRKIWENIKKELKKKKGRI